MLFRIQLIGPNYWHRPGLIEYTFLDGTNPLFSSVNNVRSVQACPPDGPADVDQLPPTRFRVLKLNLNPVSRFQILK